MKTSKRIINPDALNILNVYKSNNTAVVIQSNNVIRARKIHKLKSKRKNQQ